MVELLASLLALTALEVILGIDNIVVLSVLLAKLPPEQRPRVRKIGLWLALGTRLGLLATLSAIMSLKAPIGSVMGHAVSGRDLVLIGGGAFLVWKAAQEIFEQIEGGDDGAHGEPGAPRGGRAARYGVVLAQVVAMDVVFSLDSVIAAVGMAQRLGVMAASVVLGALVMMASARHVAEFLARHPSMKVLALSFLLLVGVLLVADGFGRHLARGYVYFAMAFAFGVELVNIARRRRADVSATAVSAVERAPRSLRESTSG